MADEHLEKTLSDLVSQKQQKISEIAKLDAAIEAIQRLRDPHMTVAVSDNLSLQAVLGPAVKPGDYFGKSAAEATQEYLRRRRNAATLDEIFSALEKGGARLQGKDPKKNLYISLVRRKALFVLVAPYTFGLWEFYPEAKKTRVGGESLVTEQLKEVMQDGKTHRMVEIVGLLEQKFGQKFSRSTVVSALGRNKEFRRIRRGVYKLVED